MKTSKTIDCDVHVPPNMVYRKIPRFYRSILVIILLEGKFQAIYDN